MVLQVVGVFFFFQAEDGIRDYKVTGVQTCALPISTEAAETGERREALAFSRRRVVLPRGDSVQLGGNIAQWRQGGSAHYDCESSGNQQRDQCDRARRSQARGIGVAQQWYGNPDTHFSERPSGHGERERRFKYASRP